MLGIPDVNIFGLAIVTALGSTLYGFVVILRPGLPRAGLWSAFTASLVALAMAMFSTWVD
jgi:hypothetical protein